MGKAELLKKIEGKQTVETISEILGIGRQSTLNLMSKLKKQGHATVSGGGHQKRIYTISRKMVRKGDHEGMFDILNKFAPKKIIPLFIHEPHTRYNVENAVIDLIELDDTRILLNMLSLFNHIKNWSLLYSLAKKSRARKKLGALYDIARTVTKVRKMPAKTRKLLLKSTDKNNFIRSSGDFAEIECTWGVNIPFNKKDLEAYK